MFKKYFKNKAFTLAEIMIVLTIIGVLTAILLPVAIQSAPDENIMKFKNGNNILATVIRELVNSDKYYSNGDLGTRANGKLINGKNTGDYTYFCNSFAEIVSIKSLNCSNITCQNKSSVQLNTEYGYELNEFKRKLDEYCSSCANKVGAEIILTNDIVYFQTSPSITYGRLWADETSINDTNRETDRQHCINDYGEEACNTIIRLFSSPSGPIYHQDANGFDRIYKVFCMDVDGINTGEEPFGYGIRADGKIITGQKADEWINKSIQQGD